MRERVMQAHRIPEDRFDVKHSAGGMVDVEFAVQYLVLSQAARYPILALNSGNIALLLAAEKEGLLSRNVGSDAANAYRQLRSAQHLARLDEQNPQLEQTALKNEQSAVKALWKTVFA
jgi:glutamate-ammonia-ligase adenylyltransferase